MRECGLYRVVDKRDYRGHSTGTEFPARLEPRAEHRAILRGSIVRLGTLNPRPESFTFPSGWLPLEIPDNQQRKEA